MAALKSTLDDRPPVDPATLRAVRRFLDLVGERYPVRDAYLFGSRARGTHHPDSDADVAGMLALQQGRMPQRNDTVMSDGSRYSQEG